MSKFETAKNLYLTAQKCYDQNDLKQTGELISDLKLALIDCTAYLPSHGNDPNTKEHCLTRSALELFVFYSISVRDIDGFERYMQQLKPYYQDFEDKSSSTYTDQMTGLYLLFLLAKNETGKFHVELEKIDNKKLEASHYLQHPVKLEQSLMEGNYGKVFLARDNIPAPEYKFFMDELTSTIRTEIADCMEASFNKKKCLPTDEVARLLHFRGVDSEFLSFVQCRHWEILDGNVKFLKTQNLMAISMMSIVDNRVASNDTTKSMIDYARELEVII